MTTTEQFAVLSRYCTTTHHTPGRLRVKIDKSIARHDVGISLEALTALPGQVTGLHQIKINRVMATGTILYDPAILPPALWDRTLAGVTDDETKKFLRALGATDKECA